jgi:hypothetical protein
MREKWMIINYAVAVAVAMIGWIWFLAWAGEKIFHFV